MLNAYNHVYLESACRAKVRRFLVNKFPTIADAEEAYQITYIGPTKLSRPSTSARIRMLECLHQETKTLFTCLVMLLI